MDGAWGSTYQTHAEDRTHRWNAEVLAADVALLGELDRAIGRAEDELAEILPRTPAGILTTMARVVVRASAYWAALGDPSRFRTAAQVYRMAGLVPRLYESVGRNAPTHPSPGRGSRSSARRSSS